MIWSMVIKIQFGQFQEYTEHNDILFQNKCSISVVRIEVGADYNFKYCRNLYSIFNSKLVVSNDTKKCYDIHITNIC